MAIDIITLALARKYTKDTANALGAVRGAPCMIDSIVDTGDANVVTFGWTGLDGTHQTSEMIVRHGAGIADMNIDDTGLLTCTLTDGTVIEVGQLPTGNCCDPDTCTCITDNMATDDDVDPLLTAIGLYDMTAAALMDELNNLLTDEVDNVLTT
jgi:hypothetical protein